MNIYIDTCVLPRLQLQTGRIYREHFGKSLGFELLMMFDLPGFEENLKQNLDLFADGPLMFHEPVWGVDHAVPKGSKAWEEGMYHLQLTKKYAEILHPSAMVFHLNNSLVKPGDRDRMLRCALENLEEMQEMFRGVNLLVENTGTRADGTMLLDQAEFTDLCSGRNFPVLIDIGHANANGWDIPKLIRDLQGQICGYHLHNNDGIHDLHNRILDGTLDFKELIPVMDRMTPDASRVIEYSRPIFHGEPLLDDIRTLNRISEEGKVKKPEEESPENSLMKLSPEQIQYILMNTEDAVCLTGMGGELLYSNAAAEKLFGIHADGHTKIWNAIPIEAGNDALVQLFINGVMEKKDSLRSLVDYINNEGKRFQLLVNLTCGSEESRTVLIVISDLTHEMRAHTALARYTSPEIADYVMTAPEGTKQGGQEREVSILMSDLRGFTAMSTHLSPIELITELNHYFEIMSDVIRRYGGTIIEFLGDGIFVVFGAPSDMPEHASAAVSCALDMQNSMTEVNAWNREQGFPELNMGIGISSGMCVVGNIGSGNRMKYGCMGETVNLAGRMESFCIGGQIHISEETRKRVPEELIIAGEDTFMPKGGREAMKYYNISGIGKSRTLETTEDSIQWKAPAKIPEIEFYLLDGKVVEMESCAGQLAKISEDEKYGLLTTEIPLKPKQDIMIRKESRDLYAKVICPEDNGYRIGFTMKEGSLE